jgi:hypothetical protein
MTFSYKTVWAREKNPVRISNGRNKMAAKPFEIWTKVRFSDGWD